MIKTNHQFTLYATDDHRPTVFTRWRRLNTYATRGEAWAGAKIAVCVKCYRHVKITESRLFSTPRI